MTQTHSAHSVGNAGDYFASEMHLFRDIELPNEPASPEIVESYLLTKNITLETAAKYGMITGKFTFNTNEQLDAIGWPYHNDEGDGVTGIRWHAVEQRQHEQAGTVSSLFGVEQLPADMKTLII